MKATIAAAWCILATSAMADESTLSLKQGPGRELVEANCVMCHSLDYIEMNDPESFDELSPDVSRGEWEADQAGRPVIISGAMYVGKTRLIDNIVLGARHTLGIVD